MLSSLSKRPPRIAGLHSAHSTAHPAHSMSPLVAHSLHHQPALQEPAWRASYGARWTPRAIQPPPPLGRSSSVTCWAARCLLLPPPPPPRGPPRPRPWPRRGGCRPTNTHCGTSATPRTGEWAGRGGLVLGMLHWALQCGRALRAAAHVGLAGQTRAGQCLHRQPLFAQQCYGARAADQPVPFSARSCGQGPSTVTPPRSLATDPSCVPEISIFLCDCFQCCQT